MSPAIAAAVCMKSPEAFRTISEVAIELDVPQHVLRFWEGRFKQVRPLKRAGNRRFYRPDDVHLLRGIRTLLYHEGYTIKGVQKVLRERGYRHVAEVGRNDTACFSKNQSSASGDDIPEDSIDALTMLAYIHAEASLAVAEGRRSSLEILLTELLDVKARMAAARRSLR